MRHNGEPLLLPCAGMQPAVGPQDTSPAAAAQALGLCMAPDPVARCCVWLLCSGERSRRVNNAVLQREAACADGPARLILTWLSAFSTTSTLSLTWPAGEDSACSIHNQQLFCRFELSVVC